MVKGRKSLEEMEILRNLIKYIIEQYNTTSPSAITRILEKEYNKTAAKLTIMRIRDEILASQKAQSPLVNQETSKTVDEGKILTVEYENHPDIIAVNKRINDLLNEYKLCKNNNEKCRLSHAIDAALENKFRLKKMLKETELLNIKETIKQYVVYIGEPSIAEKPKEDVKNEEKKDEKS